MHPIVFTPYISIALALSIAQIGLRPAMLSWGMCMLGALGGLSIAIIGSLTDIAEIGCPGVITATLPFVVTVITVVRDLRCPRLNDVATDPDRPIDFTRAPNFKANLGRDMRFPKRFAPLIRAGYPDLRPLVLDTPRAQVFHAIEQVAHAQAGWRITHRDTENFTLELTARTSLLRFVDDVAIRVSSRNGATQVDMRSKSREGLLDAGTNAKRINSFFDQLTTFLAQAPPPHGTDKTVHL